MRPSVPIKQLLTETFQAWQQDSTSEWSAALAFFTILSLAPTLVIVVGLCGFVFGEDAARGEVLTQISGFVGPGGAVVLQTVLAGARNQAGLATFLGTVTLLFGASAVFVELQTALNRIWRVPQPSFSLGRFLLDFVRNRILSFLMILGIGFLLLVSVVVSAILSATARVLGTALPMPSLFLHTVNFLLSLALITALFAMIYRVLPAVRSPWPVVWAGAGFTSALFTIGQSLIGAYLASTVAATAYGAATSFVVFLLWIYYSAQIFFLGAEFTYCYAKLRAAAD
ncbi:MAG: YihY/virulence factor BrkB family protein [Bryobacteraceae bacterium]